LWDESVFTGHTTNVNLLPILRNECNAVTTPHAIHEAKPLTRPLLDGFFRLVWKYDTSPTFHGFARVRTQRKVFHLSSIDGDAP